MLAESHCAASESKRKTYDENRVQGDVRVITKSPSKDERK